MKPNAARLLLLVAMVVALGGCGNKGRDGGSESDPELAARKKRLQQVARALYDYSKANDNWFPGYDSNGFPPNRGAKRKQGLSWRVYILPDLGYKDLYEQFRLDEPWDGPNNKKLLTKMPEEFKTHGVAEPDKTALHVFIEPAPKGSIVGGGRVPFSYYADGGFVGPRTRIITDGTPNTLMFVEAGSDKAEPWTKPTGLPFDLKGTSPAVLGKTDEESFLFAFFDGSVGRISKSISQDDLLLLLRHNDHKTGNDPAELKGVERLD